MTKLIWIALLGFVLAGCASDKGTRSGSASGSGSSATTAPAGTTSEDAKKAPGTSTAPRSTY